MTRFSPENIGQIISARENKDHILTMIYHIVAKTFGNCIFVSEKTDKNLDFHLRILNEVKSNFSLEYPGVSGLNCLALPCHFGGKRLGTLLITSDGHVFSQEDIRDATWVCHIISILQGQNIIEEERHHQAAKNVISMLSYSELEAALHIFKDIPQDSLVVIGKIAQKFGFSRSIIGSAIKKIESSGAIETRSLGMKGTNIKIINKKLIEEFNKIR